MSVPDSLLKLDSTARTLQAGDVRAVFLPARGMLGASLQYRGQELLGRVEDIQAYAESGRTCGIPLLYPWANRLSGPTYTVAGKTVSLTSSKNIGHDDRGLPMHGVPWSRLMWRVTGQSDHALTARLDWNSQERLAVFPFPHSVDITMMLKQDKLAIEVSVNADADSPVPVSFGFHPYFKIPDMPRAEWHVQMPAMSHLQLDAHGIPTGAELPFPAVDEKLGTRAFDDGFRLLEPAPRFTLAGGGRHIQIDFTEGYSYAQLFAPPAHDYIAFEPMTAPANALVSGEGLRIIEPGATFRARFQIEITALT